MTSTTDRGASTTTSTFDPGEEAEARLAPVLDRIAATTATHEVERTLPHEEVRLLADAGFGALRIPVAEGGAGWDLARFFRLLVRLAAADSNQPQIWRNHIAFVEDRLQPEPAAQNRYWREIVASGAVVGGAWTERGGAFSEAATRLSPDDGGGWTLTGTKYYSTGSIFADRISVYAKRDDEDVIALVDARHPGVRQSDDWNGIGQRVTGSGTCVFTDVPVSDLEVYPFGRRAPYQEAVYQLVLLASLAGVARAAHRDVVAALRARTRRYPQGLTDVPREDPQLQAVVGRVAALASSAEASVARAAQHLDAAASAVTEGEGDGAIEVRVHEAAVAVYEAQLTVTEDVLAAATLIFDALGSSAVERTGLLDRHWRNARTLTSHNPRVYKERIVGAWYLVGAPPTVFGVVTPATAAVPSG